MTINQGASQADPVSGSPVVFDVVFGESVTGFDTAKGGVASSWMLHEMATRGITLHIAGIKLPVERVLQRAGELPTKDAAPEPLLQMYRTDAEALVAFQRLAPTP